MDFISLGKLKVSRFILGSNPFSGFSHQGTETDLAMKRYHTSQNIKRTILEAEALGVNTIIARTDFHVMRLLLEYGDEGGQAQWFAQTCPEVGDPAVCVDRAASGGAKACHLHGGFMDFLLAQGRMGEVPPLIDRIRAKGMLAGIAGHTPGVFEWAEKHLDVDYYMCCYYNPTPRQRNPEHVAGLEECYLEEDRQAMTALIKTLSRPVVHYKILAAGRNDPAAAFAVAAGAMRPTDAVCVGVYTNERPGMLTEDVTLLHSSLRALGK